MVLGSLLAGAAGGATVSIFINAIDNFSRTFAKANGALTAIGAGLTAIGVVGAVAVAGVTKIAIDFESAFAGVKKTVDLTEEGFNKLNKRFQDISKETPIAFTELSRIGELAGQLGVSGVDNLEKFTKTIADISVTTNLTSEQAATDFARIANIMQEPLQNVDRMGSAIVDLGNNFATTEAEISLFAQRIAGAGNIVGLTTSDVLAIGTAFSSVGVRAEAGGTAVQKMLIEMNTAVAQGGEKLDLFAQINGQTTDEFIKSWKDEAGPTFAKFIIGLGQQGDEAVNTLDELGMSDVRLVRSFLSLANAGDLVTDTFNIANDAWEENNALTEEASKRYETAQSQIIIFKNKLAILGNQMGKIFIPILIKVLDKLGILISWMEEHPKLTKFAIVTVAIASAIGLVLGPLAILIGLFPLMVAGLTAVSVAGAPVWLVTLAIAAGIAAIIAAVILVIKIFKEWDNMSTKTKALLWALTTPIMAVVTAIKSIIWVAEKAIKVLEKLGILQKKTDKKSRRGERLTTIKPDESGVINLGSSVKTAPTIYIGNINGLSGKDIANSLQREVRSVIKIN